MAVTIWTQQRGTTRNTQWYAQVVAQFARTNAAYIAPDRQSAQHCITQILQASAEPLWGDVVLDTAQWLAQLADERRPLLSTHEQRLLLRELLHNTPLHYFASTRSDIGTIDFILRAIEQLVRTGIDAAQLQELVRTYGTDREREIFMLYQAFTTRLHEYNVDHSASVATRALRRTCSGDSPDFATLMIETGYRPIPQLGEIITAYVARGCHVHLILPPGEDDTSSAHALSHFLRSLAAQCELHWQEVSACECDTDTQAADPMVWRASSPIAETRAIAQRITSHLQEGLAPEQCGIVVLNAQYESLLRHALREHELLLPHAMASPLHLGPVARQWWEHDMWQQAPSTLSAQGWLEWWQQHWAHWEQAQPSLTPQHGIDARHWQHLHGWHQLWLQFAQCAPAVLQQRFTADAWRRWVWHAAADQSAAPLREQTALGIYQLGETPNQRLQYCYLPGACEGDIVAAPRHGIFSQVPVHSPHPAVAQLRCIFEATPSRMYIAEQQLAAWNHTCAQWHVSYPELSDSNRNKQLCSWIKAQAIHDLPSCQAPATTQWHELKPSPPTRTELEARITHERHMRSASKAEDQLLLVDPIVRSHVQERYRDHAYSVSELERYARCPYSFFAHHLMQVPVPDEVEPDPQPKTRGQVLHAGLAQLYQHHLHTIRAWSSTELHTLLPPLCQQILQQIITQDAALFRDHHGVLSELALADLSDKICALVSADHALWAAQEQPLLPHYYEWRFGPKHQPVTLQNSLGRITLQGAIDRIDVDPTSHSALIVDYKLGKGKNRSIKGAVQEGRHLQIPLYVLAAQQAFPTLHIRGGLLAHLGDGLREHGMIEREFGKSHYAISGRKGSSLTAEQWEQLLQHAQDIAIQYAADIAGARVPLRTHDCQYCEWLGATRSEATCN